MKCPCKSQQSYALCCGRFHKGKLQAPTAEALMRSRYTAYVLGDAQYLYRSWHPETRPSLQSLRQSGAQPFVDLEILSSDLGGTNDETGAVEFIATFDNQGTLEPQHENSRFKRIKGKWVYHQAEDRCDLNKSEKTTL